jgi:hypothetical protein
MELEFFVDRIIVLVNDLNFEVRLYDLFVEDLNIN